MGFDWKEGERRMLDKGWARLGLAYGMVGFLNMGFFERVVEGCDVIWGSGLVVVLHLYNVDIVCL